MSAITAPSPASEVAIIGDFGKKHVLAHRVVEKVDDEESGPADKPRRTAAADCNKKKARTFSFAYARSRGAKPCGKCWAEPKPEVSE